MKTFTNFRDTFDALPADRQERIKAKAQAIQAHINLINVGKELLTTQRELAER